VGHPKKPPAHLPQRASRPGSQLGRDAFPAAVAFLAHPQRVLGSASVSGRSRTRRRAKREYARVDGVAIEPLAVPTIRDKERSGGVITA
jgi:hypothetical protein